MSSALPLPAVRSDRAAYWAGAAALVGMFLVNLAELTFVDPDLWHEMALARETFALGHLPWDDRWAYTPTVYPVVHHEWGAGFLFYLFAHSLGAPGIMILKYALTLGVAASCYVVARRRGASQAAILTVAPAVVLAGCYGFTTIRAQLLTMCLLGLLMLGLDADSRGRRRWMIWWLPLYLVWLNVHAGFVVGLLVVATHAVEQALRRQPYSHLLALLAAMSALVLVNPYGTQYVPYLVRALAMPRPMILEWRPLWANDPTTLLVYLASVLLVAYAAAKRGVRQLDGILCWAPLAYEALMHTRHLSLYFVVWLCLVPAWLQATALGELIDRLWTRQRWAIIGFGLIVTALCFARAMPAQPWRMRLPVTLAEEQTGRPLYPGGAVEYLKDVSFRGNLMVPFVPGGYVMWKLHPQVKISLDGRYEVAYRHGMLEEIEALYQAKPGWEETLTRYPTDAVLVPRGCPLAEKMASLGDWRRVYRDGAFDVYARPQLALPQVDRGEATPAAVFP